MTWIKICGTTNLEDAQMCAEAGADALGFVFAERPRKIAPEKAAKICPALNGRVQRIGVFQDQSIDFVTNTAKQASLTLAQLHGGETGVFVDRLVSRTSIKVIRAFPFRPTGWQRIAKSLGLGYDLASS